MNVDPNGQLDVRTRDIRVGVDVAVSFIPGIGAISRTLANGSKKLLKKLLTKKKQQDIAKAIYNSLVELGAKASVSKKWSNAVIGMIRAAVGTSIGDVTVSVLKKNLKVVYKKRKNGTSLGILTTMNILDFKKGVFT